MVWGGRGWLYVICPLSWGGGGGGGYNGKDANFEVNFESHRDKFCLAERIESMTMMNICNGKLSLSIFL